MLDRPVYYAALGDSITVGVGSLLAPGFVKQYAIISEKALQTRVFYQKFAKNGANSRDVIRVLEKPNCRRAIAQADIITITAGGNDLIDAGRIYSKTGNANVFRASLEETKSNFSYIISTIANLQGETYHDTMIRIVNLYNPNPGMPEAAQWINEYNSYLYSLSSANVRIADVYSVFQQDPREFLFIDHIHPNRRGYQVIAHQLYLTGYSPLVY